jgi:hypothetical protein
MAAASLRLEWGTSEDSKKSDAELYTSDAALAKLKGTFREGPAASQTRQIDP